MKQALYKLEISESEEELKHMLRVQKTASDKERIQMLYLLKTKQASTIQTASTILGRHRVTLQDWLGNYRKGGIVGLLGHKPRTGRKQSIPQWAQKALIKKLEEAEGFESYGQICQWLENQLGIKSNYKTVHHLVRYRLKARPKVTRPVSAGKSEEQVEAYKKTLPVL
ncbi:transposase [Synechococcus sp. PCC 7502]|uniref:helix-turn-helix domain-containing protein n=1 Tax=Synechococcus sp. PCC 7502 TaxID=1173263 RepID=UPI00029FCAF1|nr:helix-turn-helix domain-containing protein [Synechococcus sp. PCC 7502]AFY73332.1 transposase [Synechococcus sp. PCC 7502]